MEKSEHLGQNPQFSPDYIYENVLLLRRKIRMSQKEFMNNYLKDENGKSLISVGTYSNFENGTGRSAIKIAQLIAKKLEIDENIFKMHPDAFAFNIDNLLEKTKSGFVDILSSPVNIQKAQSYTDSLVRIISDYLTDGIMCGEIRPGDKLPSDRDLAEKFQVGRSTIREALRVISLIGLIEIRPGQGSFVALEPSDFFITPLSWTLLLGKKSIQDVIVMRNILELGSARLAALNSKESDLKEFSCLMSRMEKAHKSYDFKAFLSLDLEFHLMVAKCSQNPIISELLHTSRKLLILLSKSGMETIAHIDSIYLEHIKIYSAILNQDAALAALAMEEHLESSSHRYTYLIKKI